MAEQRFQITGTGRFAEPFDKIVKTIPNNEEEAGRSLPLNLVHIALAGNQLVIGCT